jgi:hypothetical protein
LQIINAALHGEFLRERSPVTNLFIIAMTGCARFRVVLSGSPSRKALFQLRRLCVGYVVFARLLFDHAGQVIPLAGPAFGFGG